MALCRVREIPCINEGVLHELHLHLLLDKMRVCYRPDVGWRIFSRGVVSSQVWAERVHYLHQGMLGCVSTETSGGGALHGGVLARIFLLSI